MLTRRAKAYVAVSVQ